MKRITASLLGVAAVFGGIYACTHRISYTTEYPRKSSAIESVFLSSKGDALLQTADGFIVIALLPQFQAYPFGPSSRNELKTSAPLPHWNQLKPGLPPKELLAEFVQVPLYHLTDESFSKTPDPQKLRQMDAAVVFENEGFAYGQQFAWLSFRLYSNRPQFAKFDAKIFTIELPSELKWHILPSPTKFMSIGG